MSSIAISGSDTIIINDRVLVDLADGDCANLDFPNDISNLKVGKNGNAIFGLNEMGKIANLTLRILRASEDDKFLNNLLSQQQANFAGFTLLKGQVIKKMGNGAGVITSDTYVVSGGAFKKQVKAKSNVEGDSEQSVAVYEIHFALAPRALT